LSLKPYVEIGVLTRFMLLLQVFNCRQDAFLFGADAARLLTELMRQMLPGKRTCARTCLDSKLWRVDVDIFNSGGCC